MKRISLTETAHNIIREHLSVGAIAIDATVGNGRDTVFLAECVGETGHVYGFDIQIAALQITQQHLQQQGLHSRATLQHACHAKMRQSIPIAWQGFIQVIMFNLGYLPGADKSIITRADSTLQAVQAACELLACQGLMTVMAYPGHVGGEEETASLEQWLQTLDTNRYSVEKAFNQQHQANSPRLFIIRKLG